MAGPDKKANLLILCFLGNTTPSERYAAIGDTKSAKGPTDIRVRVFAAAMRFTWNGTPDSESEYPVIVVEEGSDATIVPIFEIIISHYECIMNPIQINFHKTRTSPRVRTPKMPSNQNSGSLSSSEIVGSAGLILDTASKGESSFTACVTESLCVSVLSTQLTFRGICCKKKKPPT